MKSEDQKTQSGGPFLKAFQGVDRFEPYLIRDWLLKNGITAEVRGFDLGTLGALPNFEEFPSVWVPESELENAKHLIGTFQPPPNNNAPWICSQCQEQNPGEFGSCWNCGADSPNLK